MLLAGSTLGASIASSSAPAAIYWAHNDGPSGAEQIGRSNLDGSNADPDFITMPPSHSYTPCGGVAVDATHIYWAANGLGTIGRAELDGSDANWEFITGASRPCGIAIDSGYLYWTHIDSTESEWHIGRAKLDGTDVQPNFLQAGRLPCALASFGSYLYGNSLDPEGPESKIYRVSSDGSGAPHLYISGAGVEAGCGIAIAGEYIYWTDFEGSIGRARLNGTQVEPRFISDLLRPCGIALHDGLLYWSEQSLMGEPPGSISRANADGSDVQRGIVSGLHYPCQLAIDDLPVPPEPEAHSEAVHLRLGPSRHDRRTGAIRIGVSVNAAGSLELSLRRQFRARLLGGSSQLTPGRRWLKISLAPGTKRAWPRVALRRRGSVEINLRLRFLPMTGSAVFKSKTLLMRRVTSRN